MPNLISNNFKSTKSSIDKQKFAGTATVLSVAIVPANSDEGAQLIGMPSPLVSIIIYESMFKQTLSGSIIVNEAVALPDITPLIGAEKIIIAWTIEGSNIVVNKGFRIINIRDRIPFQGNQTGQNYVIEFVSDERMMDSYSTISKAYTGPVHKTVKKIYDEYLDAGKPAEFQETDINITYIPPRLHPFDAIARISKYAATDLNAAYFFFENLDGFHYNSINTLFEQSPINESPYIWDIKNYRAAQGATTEDEMMKMNGYKIENSFSNPLSALRGGKYASSSYSHDMYSKKINRGPKIPPFTYDYLKTFYNDKVSHSEKHAVIPINGMNFVSGSKSSKTAKLNKAKESHFEVVTTNTYLYGNENKSVVNHPNSTQNSLGLIRNSQRQELENFKISVSVPGHPNLTIGNVINVSLRSERVSDKYIESEIMSGNYLIVEATHEIMHDSTEYTTKMTLVKDSSKASLEGQIASELEIMGDP